MMAKTLNISKEMKLKTNESASLYGATTHTHINDKAINNRYLIDNILNIADI
jgi:hypothetical protein